MKYLEKIPEAKKARLVGGEPDLFTRGLRRLLHELLREVAKCLMLLPHTHMQVESSTPIARLRQQAPPGGGGLPDWLEHRS